MRIVIDVSDDAIMAMAQAMEADITLVADAQGRPVPARRHETVEQFIRSRVESALMQVLDVFPTPAMREKKAQAQAKLNEVEVEKRAVIAVSISKENDANRPL